MYNTQHRGDITFFRTLFTAICICCLFKANAQTRSKLQDTIQCPEIVIKAKTSVKVKGDTISYTVDSFSNSPTATTEDALKRLPGIDIDKDGKISIQGKDVTKIFINGQEYDAGDLRTITQNLPAEILSKIQITDYYDEDKQFSGIRNGSDKKIINLQFKKEYEHGIYGKISAGYGSKQRYQSSLFANYISNNIHLTDVSIANNTGLNDIASGNGDKVQQTSGSPGQTIKQSENLYFNIEKYKKIKISGTYEFSNTNFMLQQSMYRNTYLPGDSQLINAQNSEIKNKRMQHRLSMRSRYKQSKQLNINSDVNIYYRTAYNNNISNDAAYQDNIQYFSRISSSKDTTENLSLMLSNTFQKRFLKVGRTLSIQTKAGFTQGDKQSGSSNYNKYSDPFRKNYTAFEKEENANEISGDISFQYNEPITTSDLISVKYAYQINHGKSNRTVYETAQDYTLDSLQSLDYDTHIIQQPFGILYQHITKKMTISISADAQYYTRKNMTVTNNGISLNQKGIYYNPTASFQYRFTENTCIGFNYGGSITPPSIKQLQPTPDYTDSLNIYVGNPSLRPQITNTVSLNYNYVNTSSQRLVWMKLMSLWVAQQIITTTEIHTSYSVQHPLNLNGNYTLGISGNYSQPIMSKKLKASIGINSSLTNIATIINGNDQNTKHSNIQPNLKLSYSAAKWFDGDILFNYQYSDIVADHKKNHLETYTLTNTLSFIFFKGIHLSSYINLIWNKGFSTSNDRFLVLNFLAEKSLLRRQNLLIQVKSLDLLNNYPTTQRTYGDNYYEDKTVSSIGRYLTISLVYKFLAPIQ